MADSTINGLTQAQTGYIDRTDEFVVQKSGESTAKKLSSSDIFGGWKDLLAPFSSAKIPTSNAPTWTLFQPGGAGGLYQYAFAVNDEVFVTYHVDHDMKQDATMYAHMHWATNGTSTNSVKWEIEYSLADRSGSTTFGSSTTFNIEGTPTATAYEHEVTEAASGITTPEIDTIIIARIKRVTNGGTDNTDTVFGITLDWHYPTEGFATKNRNPDFYS